MCVPQIVHLCFENIFRKKNVMSLEVALYTQWTKYTYVSELINTEWWQQLLKVYWSIQYVPAQDCN